MKKKINLPDIIPIFPLSNFIFFPKTTVPLNIFEERYLNMIDDTMKKKDRLIGMIQPQNNQTSSKNLYEVGCVGKITSFNETDDGRYLIALSGVNRFKIIEEIESNKLYRECKISYNDFYSDQEENEEKISFKDLEPLFRKLKNYFSKQGLVINWKELEKQDLEFSLNTLSMAAPFSLEEKQALIESQNLRSRQKIIENILETYILDEFNNNTIQ